MGAPAWLAAPFWAEALWRGRNQARAMGAGATTASTVCQNQGLWKPELVELCHILEGSGGSSQQS